ncbi:MAG TPA: hypothetical protein VFI09_06145 [Solirubrobacterales bacterium]|nr:hypothetical protein [Solirubrobacterales bacterium]
MADQNPTDRAIPDPSSPQGEDRQVQWAVLAFLLDEYPDHQLTIPEVSSAMNAGETDFKSEDAVERAIRELVGAGLLHCKCGFVLPARAALVYWSLAA